MTSEILTYFFKEIQTLVKDYVKHLYFLKWNNLKDLYSFKRQNLTKKKSATIIQFLCFFPLLFC